MFLENKIIGLLDKTKLAVVGGASAEAAYLASASSVPVIGAMADTMYKKIKIQRLLEPKNLVGDDIAGEIGGNIVKGLGAGAVGAFAGSKLGALGGAYLGHKLSTDKFGNNYGPIGKISAVTAGAIAGLLLGTAGGAAAGVGAFTGMKFVQNKNILKESRQVINGNGSSINGVGASLKDFEGSVFLTSAEREKFVTDLQELLGFIIDGSQDEAEREKAFQMLTNAFPHPFPNKDASDIPTDPIDFLRIATQELTALRTKSSDITPSVSEVLKNLHSVLKETYIPKVLSETEIHEMTTNGLNNYYVREKVFSEKYPENKTKLMTSIGKTSGVKELTFAKLNGEEYYNKHVDHLIGLLTDEERKSLMSDGVNVKNNEENISRRIKGNSQNITALFSEDELDEICRHNIARKPLDVFRRLKNAGRDRILALVNERRAETIRNYSSTNDKTDGTVIAAELSYFIDEIEEELKTNVDYTKEVSLQVIKNKIQESPDKAKIALGTTAFNTLIINAPKDSQIKKEFSGNATEIYNALSTRSKYDFWTVTAPPSATEIREVLQKASALDIFNTLRPAEQEAFAEELVNNPHENRYSVLQSIKDVAQTKFSVSPNVTEIKNYANLSKLLDENHVSAGDEQKNQPANNVNFGEKIMKGVKDALPGAATTILAAKEVYDNAKEWNADRKAKKAA